MTKYLTDKGWRGIPNNNSKIDLIETSISNLENSLNQTIGNKSELDTSNKQSIVDAINEVNTKAISASGGDLTSYQKKDDNTLTTSSKSIVGAIDEINTTKISNLKYNVMPFKMFVKKTITLKSDSTYYCKTTSSEADVVFGSNISFKKGDIIKVDITIADGASKGVYIVETITNYNDSNIVGSEYNASNVMANDILADSPRSIIYYYTIKNDNSYIIVRCNQNNVTKLNISYCSDVNKYDIYNNDLIKNLVTNDLCDYKYETIIPSGNNTYNMMANTTIEKELIINKTNCQNRLTFAQDCYVKGGCNLSINVTGIDEICVYEYEYADLGIIPTHCLVKSKRTTYKGYTNLTEPQTITHKLNEQTKRFVIVTGWKRNIRLYPNDISAIISSVSVPVVDYNSILASSSYNEYEVLDKRIETSSYDTTNVGSNSDSRFKPFNILHYSDLHSDKYAAEKILEIIDRYKDKLNAVCCTGDSVVMTYANSSEVSTSYNNGYPFWRDCGLAEKSLFCLGNHDSATLAKSSFDQKEGHCAWLGIGQELTYNSYFKPYVDILGFTQPENADETFANYWYKDYDDYKIRIVSIDCLFKFDGTLDADLNIIEEGFKKKTIEQEQWLVDTLNETLDSSKTCYGYGVIFMGHYPLGDYEADINGYWDDTNHKWVYNISSSGGVVYNHRTNDRCVFQCGAYSNYVSDKYLTMNNRTNIKDPDSSGYVNYSKSPNNNIGDIINRWKTNGGNYIVWIAGHTHLDMIYYPKAYPNLLTINITQAGFLRPSYRESRYLLSNKYCANYYSIDTKSKTIKIVRLGCNNDMSMTERNVLCYNYNTRKVVYEQ